MTKKSTKPTPVKTRLLKDTRQALLSYMCDLHARKLDKIMAVERAMAVEKINMAIRIKYPEKDMKVLRAYGLTRKDSCLRFINQDTREVFGLDLPWGEPKNIEPLLADVPQNGGCRNGVIFEISFEDQKIIENYTAAVSATNENFSRKENEYKSFLEACRTVEEVDAVINMPEDMKRRYISGGAIMVINPEIIAGIKAEFTES